MNPGPGTDRAELLQGRNSDFAKSSLPQRLFAPYFQRIRLTGREKVEFTLRRARMGISVNQFYSSVMFYQIIFAVVTVAAGTAIVIMDRRIALVAISSVFLANIAFIAIQLEIPDITVSRIRRNIDSILTLSIGFFATMASSGATIEDIMKTMSENSLYGAISEEARLIYVRTSLFGMDIISSIRESVRTSPSARLADILQGIITSVNSGGSVKDYFIFRAKESQDDTRARLRQNAESMGVLSESFITVGVAFPLILLIIIAVIADLFPYNTRTLTFSLFLISALVIPAILAIFAFFMGQEAGGIEL